MLAFLCLLLGAMFYSLVTPAMARPEAKTEVLTIETSQGPQKIDVEVAETPQEKAIGLMFRTAVPPGTGMLFPYKTPQEITMWMRNTYVSLDMIFINKDGTVHRVAESTTPLSEDIVASEGKVVAVLEVMAGEAERLGVKPGDRIRFRTFP